MVYSSVEVISTHSLGLSIIQMNFRSSFILRGLALALLASAYTLPAAALGNAPQTLQACRIAATAGSVLGAIPVALMGDELAMRQMADGVAALQYSNTSFASPVPPRASIARDAERFASRKDLVLKVARATQLLRQQSAPVLEAAQEEFSAELIDSAGAPRIAAANVMAMLSQRIGKSAAEFVSIDSLSPEAIFLLGKDTKTFQELLDAMNDGKPELRIKAAKTPATKKRLAALSKSFGPMKEQAQVVLSDVRGLVEAFEAQAKLRMDLAALARVARQACEQ